MHKVGVQRYQYYVGINSLEEIATQEDRVCVLNILGNESRGVTPISHEYSGGNVVFGTSPGRSGQVLETKFGKIPVYNSIREGMDAGHQFNTGVVYLPPSGVKDGVSEIIRQNPETKKIIILTEKVSVKDSRTIRAIGQINGIDIFGGNCLGVADAWNHVRIGGALGGNNPEESLIKGSIAIYSNSGNFTTTIATYLLTQGWGTTTSISSGKDVYIHFSPREFLNALNHDDRSQASVLYIEPGGYYEKNLVITKPMVACVVGRWKAHLNRACGHAGTLAGTGDDAAAKEKWFLDYFGVEALYSPENPVYSAKGAVVNNISHIPEALTKVMALNGIVPDFEPRGNLSLKCWFGNDRGLPIPDELNLPIVEAIKPYNEQIKALNQQVGAYYPRQPMKDSSGASYMDPQTHISRLHKHSILDASHHALEENLFLALLKSFPDNSGKNLMNIILHDDLKLYNDPILITSDAARTEESPPNTVLASAIGLLGKRRIAPVRSVLKLILNLFAHNGLKTAYDSFDFSELLNQLSETDLQNLKGEGDGERVKSIKEALAHKGEGSLFIDFLNQATKHQPSIHALHAAIWATLAWEALMMKRISQDSFLNLPWYGKVFSAIVGCAVDSRQHNPQSFCGLSHQALMNTWSFSETAFLALVRRRPTPDELVEWNLLVGVLLTNGPGTISSQGCKGGVSSDGPETPGRVEINKSFMAFLTHTGFAHGGNGFEAMEFLMKQFKEIPVQDPGDPNHGIAVENLAIDYARWYAGYQRDERRKGNSEYQQIPCIDHPVFRGKDVNYDPRTQYLSKVLQERGSYNIFLDYYQNLVQALFQTKVTKNVYCVNVDAVIATILLKIFWTPLKNNEISESEVVSAAFTAFLYGRMGGAAAEIDDHMNRGKDMDFRTPIEHCQFVP